MSFSISNRSRSDDNGPTVSDPGGQSGHVPPSASNEPQQHQRQQRVYKAEEMKELPVSGREKKIFMDYLMVLWHRVEKQAADSPERVIAYQKIVDFSTMLDAKLQRQEDEAAAAGEPPQDNSDTPGSVEECTLKAPPSSVASDAGSDSTGDSGYSTPVIRYFDAVSSQGTANDDTAPVQEEEEVGDPEVGHAAAENTNNDDASSDSSFEQVTAPSSPFPVNASNSPENTWESSSFNDSASDASLEQRTASSPAQEALTSDSVEAWESIADPFYEQAMDSLTHESAGPIKRVVTDLIQKRLQLQRTIRVMEEEKRQMEHDTRQIYDELDEFCRQRSAEQQEMREKESKICKLSDTLKEVEAEETLQKQGLRDHAKQSITLLVRLQTAVQVHREALDAARADTADGAKQDHDLQEKMNTVKAELDAARADATAFRTKSEDLMKQLIATTSSRNALQESLTAATAAHKVPSAAVQDCAKQSADLQEQLDRQWESRDHLLRRLTAAEDELSGADADARRHMAESRALQQKLFAMTDSRDKCAKRLASAAEYRDPEACIVRKQMDHLKLCNEMLKAAHAEAGQLRAAEIALREKSDKQAKEATALVDELEVELAAADLARRHDLRQAAESEKMKLEAMDATTAQLRGELQTLRAQATALHAEIDFLKEQLERKGAEVADVRAAADDVMELVTLNEKEQEAKRTQREGQAQDNEHVSSELAEARQRVVQLVFAQNARLAESEQLIATQASVLRSREDLLAKRMEIIHHQEAMLRAQGIQQATKETADSQADALRAAEEKLAQAEATISSQAARLQTQDAEATKHKEAMDGLERNYAHNTRHWGQTMAWWRENVAALQATIRNQKEVLAATKETLAKLATLAEPKECGCATMERELERTIAAVRDQKKGLRVTSIKDATDLIVAAKVLQQDNETMAGMSKETKDLEGRSKLALKDHVPKGTEVRPMIRQAFRYKLWKETELCADEPELPPRESDATTDSDDPKTPVPPRKQQQQQPLFAMPMWSSHPTHEPQPEKDPKAQLKASCVRLRRETLRVAKWFASHCEATAPHWEQTGVLPVYHATRWPRARPAGRANADDMIHVHMAIAAVASQLFSSVLLAVQQQTPRALWRPVDDDSRSTAVVNPTRSGTIGWDDSALCAEASEQAAGDFGFHFQMEYHKVASQPLWVENYLDGGLDERASQLRRHLRLSINTLVTQLVSALKQGEHLGMAFWEPACMPKRWRRGVLAADPIRSLAIGPRDVSALFVFPALRLHHSETDLPGETLLEECRLEKNSVADTGSPFRHRLAGLE